MNIVETEETETLAVGQENVVHLPLGLLGFERIKRYALLQDPKEAPFGWLQVVTDPGLAFLVVPVLDIMPDYAPDISAEDAEFIGLESPADALVFCIVTLRGDGSATMNLKGPVIINRNTLCGKQVVIANAAQYSVQHPLPVVG